MKIAELHPDVPVIFTPGTTEFEQLVPMGVYLTALERLTTAGIGTVEGADDSIAAWVAEKPYRANLAFSKKIEGWFVANLAAAFPMKKY